MRIKSRIIKSLSVIILSITLFGCNGKIQSSNQNKFKDIVVQLSYPSEGIPPLNIYLKDNNSGKVYLYKNYEGKQYVKFPC
jgi:hypothetical protein